MTFRADMRVENLDAIRRMYAGAAKVVDAEMRPAVRESSAVVRDKAKALAPGRKLPNSIRSEIQPGGLRSFVGSVAKTALSIHRGRKPGERVRFGLILGWVRRTGIGGAVSVRTGRATRRRNRGALNTEYELAWQIVDAIRRRGTKPIPLILPAVEPSRSRVQSIFQAAAQKALRRIARAR